MRMTTVSIGLTAAGWLSKLVARCSALSTSPVILSMFVGSAARAASGQPVDSTPPAARAFRNSRRFMLAAWLEHQFAPAIDRRPRRLLEREEGRLTERARIRLEQIGIRVERVSHVHERSIRILRARSLVASRRVRQPECMPEFMAEPADPTAVACGVGLG